MKLNEVMPGEKPALKDLAIPTRDYLTGIDPDDDRSPDLGAVVAAAESIVPYLRPGNLVVLESTVPPLTCTESSSTSLGANGAGTPGHGGGQR